MNQLSAIYVPREASPCRMQQRCEATTPELRGKCTACTIVRYDVSRGGEQPTTKMLGDKPPGRLIKTQLCYCASVAIG